MSAFIDQHRNRTTAEVLKWGVEPICVPCYRSPQPPTTLPEDPHTFTPQCPRRLVER